MKAYRIPLISDYKILTTFIFLANLILACNSYGTSYKQSILEPKNITANLYKQLLPTLTEKNPGKCPSDTEHRRVKYLNNIIESDHDKLKRRIKPTLGFKPMKTTYSMVKGLKIMRMFKTRRF